MRKVVVGVVLVLIIIAVIVFAVRKSTVRPEGEYARTAYNKLIDVIDVETGEISQVKHGDFAKKFETDPATGYKTHPETGRKALYLGDHAEWVEGMDYDEGRALIDEMNRLFTPGHLVYRHSYAPGDFVFWDNRCTMHKATGYDTAKETRVMRRCTVPAILATRTLESRRDRLTTMLVLPLFSFRS